MKTTLTFLLVLFMFIISCKTETRQNQTLFYFDINGYFEKEIDRLTILNPEINKTIVRNSKTESKIVKDLIWQTELLVFKESDINRPAFKDVYDVDSILQAGQLQIVYTANSTQPVVKQIRILIANNQDVSRIEIEKNPQKRIFEASTRLIYVPDSGYSISNKQKLATFSEDAFSIQTTFKN